MNKTQTNETARPIDKLLDACKEAFKIQATGKDSKGTTYNSIGKLNQAAWLGESAGSLIAEIERQQVLLTAHEAVMKSLSDDVNFSKGRISQETREAIAALNKLKEEQK